VLCIEGSSESGATPQVYHIGPHFENMWQKWHAALRAEDGNVYSIPYNAAQVLRINCSKQDVESKAEVELVGPKFTEFPEAPCKWGALTFDSQGLLYGLPSHARTVLRMRPGVDGGLTVEEFPFKLNKDKGKFRCGAVLYRAPKGPPPEEGEEQPEQLGDATLWAIPDAAGQVLRIDLKQEIADAQWSLIGTEPPRPPPRPADESSSDSDDD